MKWLLGSFCLSRLHSNWVFLLASHANSSDLYTQVSMIYHKKLESDWEDAARKLGSVLAESASCTSNRVHIIGQLVNFLR